MGQQQILLLILGIILLGVAVSLGFTIFTSNADSGNKDLIYSQLNYAASNGYSHFIKSHNLSGANRDIDLLLSESSINLWLPEFKDITGLPKVEKTSNGFSITVVSKNGKNKASIFENLTDNTRTVSWSKVN